MKNILDFENREEAKNAVLDCVVRDDWAKYFCIDSDGDEVCYFMDKEKVHNCNQMIGISIGYFNNKEDCYNLLRNFILDNVDLISEFMVSSMPIKTVTTQYNNPIGYATKNGEEKESRKTSACLLKSKNGTTELGFYIADFSIA